MYRADGDTHLARRLLWIAAIVNALVLFAVCTSGLAVLPLAGDTGKAKAVLLDEAVVLLLRKYRARR